MLLSDMYMSLPKKIQTADRVMICISIAAAGLKNTEYLEEFFKHEHFSIREGEKILTDVWFKYCAILLARKRDIDNPSEEQLSELEAEAMNLCPPPEYIDFRMTLNANERYRTED